MVRENRMPASAHWFALAEMRSAAGETALLRHAPGKTASRVIFFPGCQLAGIRPKQTLGLYALLLDRNDATGIWLDCCAAPAHWAGREEEFKTMLSRLQDELEHHGSPPGAHSLFNLPADLQGTPTGNRDGFRLGDWPKLLLARPIRQPNALALTDPCTSRHDEETRQAVRTLLAAMGQDLAPLAMSGELTECCGFGGLMDNADPGLARKVAAARARQSDAVFLTYCAMCRDQLAKTGKGVLHLLDLLLPRQRPFGR